MSRSRKGRGHVEERDVPAENKMADVEETEIKKVTKRKRLHKASSPQPDATETKKSSKKIRTETKQDGNDSDAEPLSKKIKHVAPADMATPPTAPVIASTAPAVDMKLEEPAPASYPLQTHDFSSADFDKLTENEHLRFMDNSKKVGAAIITKNANGDEVAYQYQIPQGTAEATPQLRPLENIEAITRFTMRRFRAVTPDTKTPMYAKRFINAKMGTKDNPTALQDVQIACFSPTNKKNGEEPFWGSVKPLPVFRSNLKGSHKKDFEKEKAETKDTIKGGRELQIHPESVRMRDGMARNPDQNTVMQGSAVDAGKDILDALEDELTPELAELIHTASYATLGSHHRLEWLHAEGFGLTPMTMDPQRTDNLGAAPKWANTEMMILERMVKWIALNRPEAIAKIKPLFEMLLGTDMIQKIKFEVTVEDKQRFLKFLQEIDTFQKYPAFRKASDIALTTALTQRLLEGAQPVKAQKVINGDHQAGTSQPMSFIPSVNSAFTNVSPATAATTVASTVAQPAAAAPVLKGPDGKILAPTAYKYGNSVVEVLTTMQMADYDEPWRGSSIGAGSGSGVVFSYNDKTYILTNGHVIAEGVVLRVRLANKKKKYDATLVKAGYMCDLALLEVTDPEFLAQAKPAQLGEMVSLQQKVTTVGFPIGGTELSISDGVVSRIQSDEYAESGEELLQVQVDASINSGNSGGPVYSDDKVVGLSFQSVRGHAGLGYMIPIVIINRFLIEAMKPEPFRGFPVLPASLYKLENSYLRRYYGMKENQTGLRVNSVDELSDAFKQLKYGDILLEIDGMAVSNEGTIDYPGIGDAIGLNHATHMKRFGESVQLKVLRFNEATKQHEELMLTVIADVAPHETEKTPSEEHDKMPTHYFASGVLFQPYTRNYADGKGTDLENHYFVEEGCTMSGLSKKNPTDQIIIVNQILDSNKTEGYDDFANSVVKKVNDKDVNNMRDVIQAIQNNTKDVHVITTAGKTHIVVPNMTAEENTQLLAKYRIKFDRSDDLPMVVPNDPAPVAAPVVEAAPVVAAPDSTTVAAAPVAPAVVPTPVVTAPVSTTVAAPITAPATVVNLIPPVATPPVGAVAMTDVKPTEETRKKRRRIIESDDEANADAKPALSILDMKGHQRYLQQLDRMERFYEINQNAFKHDKVVDLDNLPDSDDEPLVEEPAVNDDEEISLGSDSEESYRPESSSESDVESVSSTSSSSSSSSSSSESNIDNDHAVLKRKSADKAPARHGLFGKSHAPKNDGADLEEGREHHKKRKLH